MKICKAGVYPLMHGDMRHAVRNCSSCVSSVFFTCISCVPRCLFHACFVRISCVPSRQPHAYELHRKMWVCKVSRDLKVLNTMLLYVTLYSIMWHTYRIVEWYQQCTVVISWYCLMLKPYWGGKKIFFGKMIGTLCS